MNADDFGISEGVNCGIIEAHEHGIVTSASLMVRWPAAPQAAAYATAHPDLSVGLHVDLGEWIYRNGGWEPLYQVVAADDCTAVAAELSRQLDTFRQLMGKNPTHLDSHQHVHRDEPLRSLMVDAAGQMDIPLRHFTPTIRYCGQFYGQDNQGNSWPHLVSTESLIATLASLPPGFTELCCHPGFAAGLETNYLHERELEVRSLCDPRVLRAVGELALQLCSFADCPRVSG